MSTTHFPSEFRYTKDHEWIEGQSLTPRIGVTTFAVEQLGDIVHLELPKIGEEYKSGDSFGTIESTKTVSDLYMPVSGKIVAINLDAQKKPETLQSDPYHQGWLVQVEALIKEDIEKLMSSKEYEKYLQDSAD